MGRAPLRIFVRILNIQLQLSAKDTVVYSLDRSPPIPTLQGGSHPLHSFFGYNTERHFLSLCVRDPADGRKMPANGKDHVSAYCIRGVRKVCAALLRPWQACTEYNS